VLSAPVHLVGLSTSHVLFTLIVESISSFDQSWKMRIHDFNRAVTESVLYVIARVQRNSSDLQIWFFISRCAKLLRCHTV